MSTALHLAESLAPQYADTTFRDAVGRFASGVVVVSALVDDEPVGLTCQSFSSLSLMPPLVLFCAGRSSASWQRIRTAESYTVNVLSESQQWVSNQMAQRRDDKFAGIDWHTGETGAPRIDGALVHIDCTPYEVVEGGDHDIVIGRVERTTVREQGRPLLYFRSSYDTLAW
jgi:3-hydroxy-9,10-secoandrosta-1,3,5(10)-triene-9,17-dione monooxygenase reductase component